MSFAQMQICTGTYSQMSAQWIFYIKKMEQQADYSENLPVGPPAGLQRDCVLVLLGMFLWCVVVSVWVEVGSGVVWVYIVNM